MIPLEPLSAVAAAAAMTAASALYLDGRYNFRRDIKEHLGNKRFGQRLEARIQALGDHVTLYRMYQLCDQQAEAVWFEGRGWTYAEALKVTDLLAELLYEKGVRNGEFVAVFMTNAPEMVFVQLALSKIGAVPAFVNTALRNETLLHCMKVAKASIVIASPDLQEHLGPVIQENDTIISLNFGSFTESASTEHYITDSTLSSVTSSTVAHAPKSLADVAALIYTSGTSGNPKAVSIKNLHYVIVSTPVPLDADRPREGQMRIFSCLPLFHGTCLFTGLLYATGSDGAFCIGRKFSASRFSKELVDSRADRMLYVGELCRYLLKAPESEYDVAHNCRIASGNGLQKDVWAKFSARFNIPEIREFYRSTEGVAKFDNFAAGVAGIGKCGFGGPVARYFNELTYIVKFDPTTQMPYRDPSTGFCVPAGLNEPGEAIGRVNTMAFYHDYLDNPKANDAKLIKDVFRKGDVFQRSGDLLVHASDNWVRFVERAGDSYRWKGENVSAGEVREHISRISGVQDVAVFGVILAGYDGQAGAAAIVLKDASSNSQEAFMKRLYKRLRRTGLTAYQIPRLVRFIETISVNATFKHLNTEMKKRAWDPSDQSHTDSLWVLDGKKYKTLDSRAWEEVQKGKARL